MQRKPSVAGQFYPGQEHALRRMVEDFTRGDVAPQSAIGILSPHAGYIYSGAIAGETFARVEVPGKVVLLGPNHHGIGHPAAVYAQGSWLTPLGEIAVDAELAAAILAACPGMAADSAAHRLEHSLEVQLPFIQVRSPQAAIVPICLGGLPLADLLAIGEGLGRLLASRTEKILLVASSDMSHYLSGDVAREKDGRALAPLLAVDPAALYRIVSDERISMCGMMPAVVMLAAARFVGASRAELVRYGNSGEVTGDQSQVVGYAGAIVY
ncbi:MAG: AmmeMemoRadiSam system protein B [Desulfuromonadales bacterium]